MPGCSRLSRYQPRPNPSRLKTDAMSRASRLWSISDGGASYSSSATGIGFPKYPSQRHIRFARWLSGRQRLQHAVAAAVEQQRLGFGVDEQVHDLAAVHLVFADRL